MNAKAKASAAFVALLTAVVVLSVIGVEKLGGVAVGKEGDEREAQVLGIISSFIFSLFQTPVNFVVAFPRFVANVIISLVFLLFNFIFGAVALFISSITTTASLTTTVPTTASLTTTVPTTSMMRNSALPITTTPISTSTLSTTEQITTALPSTTEQITTLLPSTTEQITTTTTATSTSTANANTVTPRDPPTTTLPTPNRGEFEPTT